MNNEIFFQSFKMVFLKDQLWIGYKMSVGENKKKKTKTKTKLYTNRTAFKKNNSVEGVGVMCDSRPLKVSN